MDKKSSNWFRMICSIAVALSLLQWGVLLVLMITFPSRLEYMTVGDYKVSLDTTDNTVHIGKYTGSAAVVHIPAEIEGFPVTRIDRAAFAANLSLKEVFIPSSVSSVGDDVFMNCTSLEKVTLSEGIKSLGWRTFDNTKIKEIRFPLSIEKIGQACFFNCKALRVVAFSGLTPPSIGESCFIDGPLWPSPLYAFYLVPLDAQAAYVEALKPYRWRDEFQISVKEAEGCSYIPVGENEARIVRYWGQEKDLTVPETLGGRTVTELGRFPLTAEPLHALTLPQSLQDMYHPADDELPFAQTVTLYAHVRIDKTIGETHTLHYNLIILGDTVLPMPFDDIESDKKVYVPQALLHDYETAAGWSTYVGQIEAIAG